MAFPRLYLRFMTIESIAKAYNGGDNEDDEDESEGKK
jgi:hypothetical protein